MAKRKLEPLELSPTLIADALNIKAANVSSLPHDSKRYIAYKYAYIYRLIISTLSEEQTKSFKSKIPEPKVKDLVIYFSLSRQNFSTLKKSNPNLYSIYVDAWKYDIFFKPEASHDVAE
jgi:hypothetical protein